MRALASCALFLAALASTLGRSSADVAVLTEANFHSFLTGRSGVLFIDFYTPWCRYSRALAPVWEELGERVKEGIHLGKVDCEANEKICTEFGIDGYPTMKAFHRGKEYVDAEGYIDYGGPHELDALLEYIEKVALSAST